MKTLQRMELPASVVSGLCPGHRQIVWQGGEGGPVGQMQAGIQGVDPGPSRPQSSCLSLGSDQGTSGLGPTRHPALLCPAWALPGPALLPGCPTGGEGPCPGPCVAQPAFPTRPPAFKQSPPAIPALGANMKKRRHGDEDMYYMHVSGTWAAWWLGGGAEGKEVPGRSESSLHPNPRADALSQTAVPQGSGAR